MKLNQRKLIITLIILVIALLALNIFIIDTMCSKKTIKKKDTSSIILRKR